jgi:hypothetical protein
MKQIPFTIKIRNRSYSGYFIVNDLLQPSKNYLVFMENHMVGELMFRYTWTFTQWRWHKVIERLDDYECEKIAEYLGNVADSLYKQKKK